MSHGMTRPVWWMLWLGLVVLGASQLVLAQQGRVAVCHILPGNPGDSHILSLPQSAVAAHLAHGDNLVGPEGVDSPGTCTDGIDNDCDGLTDSEDPACTPSSCLPPGQSLPGGCSFDTVEMCCSGNCSVLTGVCLP
jgi:hypothetical protein